MTKSNESHLDPTQAKIQTNQDSRPTPDPTILTTQMVLREVSTVRELLESRMDGTDKVIMLLSDDVASAQSAMDLRVSHLQEVDDEKFQSIQTQFIERDVRTEQAAIATKIAVDAALQAQKEAAGAQNESNAAAITKSEAATVKQMDGILALFNSNSKAMDEKFADVRGRLDRGEGKSTGHGEIWAYIAAGVSILVAIAAVIITLVKS